MNPGFLIRTAAHEMRKFIERNGGQYISPHCMVPTAEAIKHGLVSPNEEEGPKPKEFFLYWAVADDYKTTRKAY
jgi:hypothetical protein